MFLPKNIDLAQLEELACLSSPPLTLEVLYLMNTRRANLLQTLFLTLFICMLCTISDRRKLHWRRNKSHYSLF